MAIVDVLGWNLGPPCGAKVAGWCDGLELSTCTRSARLDGRSVSANASGTLGFTKFTKISKLRDSMHFYLIDYS